MNKFRFLIVEDEALIAEDLYEILRGMDIAVEMASDYDGALQQIESFKPDVVFCDINLGSGKTGLDLVKTARNKYPAIEYIYISALANQHIIENAELTLPFNYIVKPFNENQIKVTARMVMGYLSGKKEQTDKISLLSAMEIKILKLIAAKKNSKTIAEELCITEKTVRNHRYNINKKLNLDNTNNSLLKWAVSNIN